MSQIRIVFRAVVFSLAGLVLVVLGVGQLLAEQWQVETVRVLRGSPERVGALLRDCTTWAKWCALDVTLGPETQREVTGTPGAVGQRIVWTGGRGRAVLEVTEVGDQVLGYTVGFEVEGAAQPGRGRFEWSPEGEGVRVRWMDQGHYANVILRWFGWFGALQERVKQIQGSSFEALQRELDQPPAAGK